MASATVTSKGQITIPKEVRDALHLASGDSVVFVVRDGGVVEMRPQTVDLRKCVGMLGSRGKHLTTAQMDRVIAEAAARKR